MSIKENPDQHVWMTTRTRVKAFKTSTPLNKNDQVEVDLVTDPDGGTVMLDTSGGVNTIGYMKWPYQSQPGDVVDIVYQYAKSAGNVGATPPGFTIVGNVVTYIDHNGITSTFTLPTPVSVVNSIDFKPTGNPNEFTVEITYTDDLGVTVTTVDTTPVVVAGADTTYTDAVTGTPHQIGTYINESLTNFVINETVTSLSFDAVTCVLTYTKEDGTTDTATMGVSKMTQTVTVGQKIAEHEDAKAVKTDILETITTMTWDALTCTGVYTSEDGTATTFTVSPSVLAQVLTAGNKIATHTDSKGTAKDIFESITTFTWVAATCTGTYTSEDGTVTTFTIDPSEVAQVVTTGNKIATHTDSKGVAVDLLETITTLALVGSDLEYTKEDGTKDVIVLPLASVSEVTQVPNPVLAEQTIATHVDGATPATTVDIQESVTTMVLDDPVNPTEVTYTSEDGTVTVFPVGCEIILTTRGSVRALRTAGNLDLCAIYAFPITQATGNGLIYMRPIDVDKVPSNVHWHDPAVTLAGMAWPAYYDIDNGSGDLQMLHDPNLNNTVYGEGSINSFPWGVTTVINNTVQNGTLNYNGGAVRDNEIRSGAIVTIDAGLLYQNEIGQNSNLTLTSGNFRENIIAGDATIIMAAGTADNNVFHSLCNVTINGGTFSENSILEDAALTVNSGSNYENVFGKTTIYNQVGTGYIRYSRIDGSTAWTNGNTNLSNVNADVATVNTTGSTGSITNTFFNRAYCPNMQNVPSLTILDSSIVGYSQISITGAARLYLNKSEFTSASRILISAGARLDGSYIGGSNYGYFQITNGYLNANSTYVQEYGYVRHDSVNTNFIARTKVSSQGWARFGADAASCRIYYCSILSGGRMYIRGTSTTCYIYYSSVSSYGYYDIANGTNMRAYYNNVTSNGKLYSINNSNTHYLYYNHVDSNGTLDMRNNSADMRFYGNHVDSTAILRIQNSATAARIYYSSFHAYYYLLATFTTGGTRSAMHAYGRRSLTITNPTSGSYVQNF